MKVRKVTLGLSFLLAAVVLLIPIPGAGQGEGFYTVSQGETRVQIMPLENPGGAAEFYNITNMQAATGYEEPNTAIFLLLCSLSFQQMVHLRLG